MKKWLFTVDKGIELRKSIKNETYGEILRLIKACCAEAVDKTTDEDMIYELEDLILTIDNEDEICDNEDYETLNDFGFDEFEELVDERLYELYNLADGWDFFLAI